MLSSHGQMKILHINHLHENILKVELKLQQASYITQEKNK